MSKFRVGVYAVVEVEVDDTSTAITRATENIEDFHDFFHPPITSEIDVVEYLASICVQLGVEDASRLDGWGDLDRGVAVMRVVDADVEHVSVE